MNGREKCSPRGVPHVPWDSAHRIQSARGVSALSAGLIGDAPMAGQSIACRHREGSKREKETHSDDRMSETPVSKLRGHASGRSFRGAIALLWRWTANNRFHGLDAYGVRSYLDGHCRCVR
ncbi:hypothetical protein MTO96_046819 [Rhipicephalus appendiculatus]